MTNPDSVYAEPPPETTEPRLGRREEVASGIPAIVQTLKFGMEAMGAGRTAKLLTTINQKQGFDCPSCAWPDPDDHRSVAEFCENGAKAVADEATTKRITAKFFADHSLVALSQKSDMWLGKQGRLTEPMVKRAGSDRYEPVSWDDAFALIASHLNALASPNEAIFYTSGRTSNEAAFLYQLFVRQFGTNNLPDCSNMCHESSGVGLGEAIGIGKGTVKLSDFDKANAIFVIGQNPGTNHPRMLSALQAAARRGATIISVNPLQETGMTRFTHPQEVWNLLGAGTQIATHHFPVTINGDVAFLKGVMKELIEADERTGGAVLNHDFIKEKTEGFDALADDLRQTMWEEIEAGSGLTRAQIQEAALITAGAKRIIFCWAMGLTQHKNGVANIASVANLALLGGHIGRPGAGLCPVRGHSNVQGDRTMGIYEKPSAKFLDALQSVFGFDPPREPGYDTVEAIEAMHTGAATVFFGMGGNFLSATPDTSYTAEALSRCDLTVHVSTKLNRAHLVTGKTALILPCLGRTELDRDQFVSVEDSMGVVHASRGGLPPASAHLLSETQIVARMAQATLGAKSPTDWSGYAANYDTLRDCVERVVPGFDDYNKRVREPGGFYLPNKPRDAAQFDTPDGKAHFTVHPIPRHDLLPGQLLLMTIRSHDQFNTTVYGLDDRYRGVYGGRRVVFAHPDDIREAGLAPEQWADITSHFDSETRTASRFKVVPYALPRRCAAAYFPEANVLVPAKHTADRSNTPAYKSVVITLAPHREP
ncbi:MAG: FdhF/YdeP family oxidoreductase [Armatimonadetes bacterium]|nr:FdhF/YdeP family oxidoreductase [Armatimonadota bacterium]